MRSFCSRPRFVVTMITPLAPRLPYTAVADASFSTEKLSTSAASTWLRSPSSPSIRTSAELLAPNVPIPRTQNSEIFFPGSPLLWTPITPATRPASVLTMFVAGLTNSSGLIVVMAPATLTLRCEPIPTTTTSSTSAPFS